jgi:hypothetical protein
LSVPYAQYETHKAAMNLTIQHAVASCMQGVPADQVTDISMQPARATRRSLRGTAWAVRAATSDEYSVVSYQVTSHDSQITVGALKAQLTNASTTGQLQEALRHYAVVYSVQHMYNVTAGPPDIVNVGDGLGSGQKQSTAQLAAAGAGAVLGVVVLVGGMAYLVHQKHGNRVQPVADWEAASTDSLDESVTDAHSTPMMGSRMRMNDSFQFTSLAYPYGRPYPPSGRYATNSGRLVPL